MIMVKRIADVARRQAQDDRREVILRQREMTVQKTGDHLITYTLDQGLGFKSSGKMISDPPKVLKRKWMSTFGT